MNTIKSYAKLEKGIIQWLNNYIKTTPAECFIVGVSGGIDSAVVSTLVAKTGISTFLLEMPINRNNEEEKKSNDHIQWLKKQFSNVKSYKIDLSTNCGNVFNLFAKQMEKNFESRYSSTKNLADANSRSRFRMIMLYYASTIFNGLVVGTGNKVEDFGIGFFTKYGDGGVDISPIADLYKTEVRELAKQLKINKEIIYSKPTDGLWTDGRTDEDQIGTTYENLEWAMNFLEKKAHENNETKEELTKKWLNNWEKTVIQYKDELNDNKETVLLLFLNKHKQSWHKTKPIPIFKYL